MLNKFLYVKKDLNYKLITKQDTNLNLFCVLKTNTNINLQLDILNNFNANINLVVYSYQNSKSKININTKTLNNESNLNINVNAIANDESQLEILVNSLVADNTINNKVNQNIKGILLSNDCRILGIPQLTINSDQVLASHALSIGGVNQEELFYLMTKGFSENQCKQIILNGFIRLSLEQLKESKQNRYLKKLNDLMNKGK